MKLGWQSNCAINEVTGDGEHVGRCWGFLERKGGRKICPRHGDVTAVQEHYAETGHLTSELDHDPRLRASIERKRAGF